MPSNVDHIADKNHVELARLCRAYQFPEFVKQADIDQVTSARDLPPTVYADPVRKQFPCDTAASTWLSTLFYQEKRAEFHPTDRAMIEHRLDHYTRYWRIKSAVDVMKARWQDLHKTADADLPDGAFAYIWVGEDGLKDRRLRLTSAMEVKAAAEYIEQYRDRFSFPVRHAMAKRVLRKAAEYATALGDHREFLERQAGQGLGDPADIVQAIQQRAARAGNGELKACFEKLAEFVEKHPQRALQADALVKLAETMDQLDRTHHFHREYSATFQPPEEVLFRETFTKTAATLHEHVATQSGKVYEKSAFTRLAVGNVRDLLGDEFAERVSDTFGAIDAEKFATELRALPRPDAEIIDDLLKEAGANPVMRKAASARQGLSAETLKALADSYASQ